MTTNRDIAHHARQPEDATFSTAIEHDSVVAQRTKIFFAPTAKVANTSIKWALAYVEGTLHDTVSTGPFLDRDQSIHDPAVNGMRSLAQLASSERINLLHDPSWIRFCVTRSPYERVLSAWFNKVLVDYLGDGDIGTFANSDAEADSDLGVMFRSFVGELAHNQRLLADKHLMKQVDLLSIDTFPYTNVIDIGLLKELAAQIRASDPPARAAFHVDRVANAGLGLKVEDVFDRATAEIVDHVYADDFERFGYHHHPFPLAPPQLLFSAREIALLSMLKGRNERIRGLSDLCRERAGGRYALGVLTRTVSRKLRRSR